MAEALTIIEKRNLDELEQAIEKHLTAFYEVGFALMQIRDNKLYREQYRTFEEYCKQKWDISRPRAYQLIAAAEVHDNLSTTVDIPERHTRAISKIKDPAEQREVYQKAVETAPDGKVTAKHIEKAVRETTDEGARTTRKMEQASVSTDFLSAYDRMQRVLLKESQEGWATTSRKAALHYIDALFKMCQEEN